eukprot:g19010.t1
MAVRYYNLWTVSYGSEKIPFKVQGGSQEKAIVTAIRNRFIPQETTVTHLELEDEKGRRWSLKAAVPSGSYTLFVNGQTVDATQLPVSGAGELDAQWLSRRLGRPVQHAQLRSLDNKQGGLSGAIQEVQVTLAGEQGGLSLVVKQTAGTEQSMQTARHLGTPREALFYRDLARKLGKDVVPVCFYAAANMQTGHKTLLLENLADWVSAGLFFGKGNPNNWGLDLPALTRPHGKPRPEQVAAAAFSLHAQLHASFWQDRRLLALPWLRAVDWLNGEGREKWEAAQQMAKAAWDSVGPHSADGRRFGWEGHAHLVSCVEASLAKVSWTAFQREFGQRPWTLVQGDCHAGNVLYSGRSAAAGAAGPRAQPSRPLLRLIDFEMVGVGSGPQELGQFCISHMTPELRRSCERQLVKDYHTELAALLRTSQTAMSFEACFQEYAVGGAARWLWFVPYLCQVCPLDMARFFIEQTESFLLDFFPDPQQVPQPRV